MPVDNRQHTRESVRDPERLRDTFCAYNFDVYVLEGLFCPSMCVCVTTDSAVYSLCVRNNDPSIDKR